MLTALSAFISSTVFLCLTLFLANESVRYISCYILLSDYWLDCIKSRWNNLLDCWWGILVKQCWKLGPCQWKWCNHLGGEGSCIYTISSLIFLLPQKINSSPYWDVGLEKVGNESTYTGIKNFISKSTSACEGAWAQSST